MTKGNQGIDSKNYTKVGVRTGSGSKGVSPGWVEQKGQAQGDHVTRSGPGTGYRGEEKFTGQNFQVTKFGNEIATNVGHGGPGTGRNLHGQAGSQGTYGSVNPGSPRPSGDVFAGWPTPKQER
jgi:hypothetical protein